MSRTVVDFVTFQIAWFACVLGVSRGTAGVVGGVLVALLVAAIHVAMQRDRGRELLLLGVVCVLGSTADAVLMKTGITSYRAHDFAWPSFMAPPWISALWIVFAMLLRDTLAWLRRRTVLAVLLGAIGGPLSCLAGVRYDALDIHPNHFLALTVLAAFWGLATPLLVGLPERGPFASVSDAVDPVPAEVKS